MSLTEVVTQVVTEVVTQVVTEVVTQVVTEVVTQVVTEVVTTYSAHERRRLMKREEKISLTCKGRWLLFVEALK